ncbi:MAG: hypothetical protein VB108_00580 [Anaerolineaceae bacterium]|nr:hypothetical protein [Anaerolineaceae bacterium]
MDKFDYRLQRPIYRLFLAAVLVLCTILVFCSPSFVFQVQAQFPTVGIPTVTGSPQGPYVIVIGAEDEDANIRSGPNATYPKVGIMIAGQTAPALGYFGNYIQIVYPGAPGGKGWIYIPKAQLINGPVPVVEPPATETPSITNTIDPTLAAQFSVEQKVTRMPTFTEPPPLLIPTFQEVQTNTVPGGIPIGLVIVILFGLGFFLALIALLRRG